MPTIIAAIADNLLDDQYPWDEAEDNPSLFNPDYEPEPEPKQP